MNTASSAAGQTALNDCARRPAFGPWRRWWPLVSRLGLIIAAVLLYRPLLLDWFTSLLGDSTFSYALWIPPLAAYLAYLRVKATGSSGPSGDFAPSYAGYAVIAAGGLLLLAGEVSTLLYIARLSFLVV